MLPAHVGMISPLLLEDELEEDEEDDDETAPDDELELEDELEEDDDEEELDEDDDEEELDEDDDELLFGVKQNASPEKNEVVGWSVQPGPSRGGPSASIEPQIGTLPELAMQAGKLPDGHLINPL